MIITKVDHKTSSWSGGTTTELFIYPQGSSYQARDFQIRISSASVDIEESTFTKLAGYNRALMILQGQLAITHQDEYTKKLSQYESDYFDGAWDTSAKGRVLDFNLMTSKPFVGSLSYETHAQNREFNLLMNGNKKLIGIYLISGMLYNKTDEKVISSGDLIILDGKQESQTLYTSDESKLIKIIVE